MGQVLGCATILASASLALAVENPQAPGRTLRKRPQDAAAKSMARQSGTAVVLDVKTGAILAIVRPEVAARRLAPKLVGVLELLEKCYGVVHAIDAELEHVYVLRPDLHACFFTGQIGAVARGRGEHGAVVLRRQRDGQNQKRGTG